MIQRQQLLQDLQRLLPKIEQDVLSHCQAQTELDEHLKQEYANAQKAQRTAEHFIDWRAAQITQASVAWILTCVFIRFLEDNALLVEPIIAGPAGTRLQHAKDRLTVYFNDHPTHAEREYLLSQFEALESLPAMGELLDHRHNPLWQLPVSADGAKSIIDFFQLLNPETGDIVHDFTDPNWDTRFLGDLYQDLSESVRKRYALLQTPEFVESFILDYTLEKAKQTFGLPGLRMIDPTCGSGHFLLTSFERLFTDWIKREPSTNARALAQRTLDAIFGVDINPYAIAIARFRLLIAAMKASGSDKINNAPDFHFNLAVGDSLLHGRRHESYGQGIQMDALNDPIAHVFDVEDRGKLEKILGQQYHVVVGNPPYIVVRDKALNQAYRDKYPTCHRQYSLGVPFTERFFDLTLALEGNQPAGYMGMITANSFMKREFGKKLIEDYLTHKDLTHVIDVSGAYIPGHGTPTVILFARNQKPRADWIRAVLGIRGEPSTPNNASEGKVWCSVVDLLEKPGSQNDYVSVADQARTLYIKHPWSIGGGGASELKENLEEKCERFLGDITSDIGRTTHTGEDSIYYLPRKVFLTGGMDKNIAPLVIGEQVRDWEITTGDWSLMPYELNTGNALSPLPFNLNEYFFPYRTILRHRKDFGQFIEERGLLWYEHSMFFFARFKSLLSITFAEVASHNHFVLDRGGKVFKQTAPVITLPETATEKDHFALLGLLNSSIVGFWMKQVSHQKQMTGGDGVRITDRSKVPYQFAGTALKKLPIPSTFEQPYTRNRIIQFTAKADALAHRLSELSAVKVLDKALKDGSSILTAWENAISEKSRLRGQLILIQEELDWTLYHAYGLCEADLLADISNWTDASIEAGQRPFEIATGINQDGFEVPATIPSQWPVDMQEKWRQRIEAIRSNSDLAIIEDPHYKRRWIGRQGLFNHSARSDELRSALQEWLLDYLEQQTHASELLTCAQLADRVRNDSAFQQVATIYTGTDTFDAQTLVSGLVDLDNVPQMAAARYKPNAMLKFRAWQETWDKQRAEDAIDARTELDQTDPQFLSKEQAVDIKAEEIGDIPLPPQYATADFRKPSYWPLRGKLDVPKERFFSLPHCEKSGDSTLVIGWAGLNHLQRAQAIAVWYIDRKERDGWHAEQLKPMLVALDELIPWLKQWHNEIDPEFGERLGDYYEGFLLEELRQLQLSRDELLTWEPPTTQRGGGRRRKTA
ncbi:BREX-2 system adenine-specific DNA-methyltransferase PglX [Methylomonas montana]|uniref:BREX-2 system adenine-specific DNA-methyltransferase PglX n=1 Tax=Methylomonas montana TaxID=3058963 RepID=UPI00265B22B8|nr:BREX-2 system adenine-specific DNA-methyltransferase PglX [Methylomonas montana]WKJ90177.1 BREX-2 system adenine-specific DNA-methyltransferase PglX [Methylomonas montana]